MKESLLSSDARLRYEASSFCCHLQKDLKRTKIKSYPFTQRLAPQRQRDTIESDADDLLRDTRAFAVNSSTESGGG